MTRMAIAILTVALVFPLAAGAQSAADFSGTWKMDASRSESAHQAVPIGPVTLVIKQTATDLSIETRRSDTDKSQVSYAAATDPATLFTIIIGGNVVSRGVTFDRLLSMYFTRDVKHRLQQDTYIQRARMFGSQLHARLDPPSQRYIR